ncbi:hypothetical protein Sjap_003328 [Stephania japonica]|uniref:Late embryogenesis abundant protein LEA-2 subgroup domain-containing protein n=1 Tax=Stephania japonica TaxID=461633 RepID=A0AAP0KNK4_9MAGN
MSSHSTKTCRDHFSLCAWILEVLIVWILIFLLICLVSQPKAPNFSITNFYSPPLDLTNTTQIINSTNGHDPQYTIATFNLQITNPNKAIRVYYQDLNVSLHYNNWAVGEVCVLGFEQVHKNSTERELRFSTGNDGELVRMRRAFSSNGSASGVSFRAGLVGGIRYGIFWWKTRRGVLDLGAVVAVGSDGKVFGGMDLKLA